MNYFITGGTGFIGTHLASLLHEVHPETRIYNLDIVEPGTPLPTVKNYKPALGNGEEHAATFIYCDVRQPIELEKVNITPDDVIFNFAAVHRTPGHPDPAYFETNIRGAENVCAFAERHGIRKIVFTSSIAPLRCCRGTEGGNHAAYAQHPIRHIQAGCGKDSSDLAGRR